MQFHHIHDLATQQHGVVSLAQLQTEGLSSKQVFQLRRDGFLLLVRKGAYRVAGTPDGWEQRMSAALLVVPGAVASHRSAARIWGIAFRDWEGCEVAVPAEWPRRKGIAVHVVPDVRSRTKNDFRVTSVEQTIVNLAAVSKEPVISCAIDEAVRLNLTTLPRICDEFGRRAARGVRGIAKLRAILSKLTSEPAELRKELERRTWRWIRGSGLPLPERQTRFLVDGKPRYADFYWPDHRLILESDGRVWHDNARSFHDDRKRDLGFAALGIDTWRITWETEESALLSALRHRLSASSTPNEESNSRKLA